MTRELKCDFCSAPDPTWECPARSHQMGVPALEHGPGFWASSAGAWLACDECAKLVRDGHRRRLTQRSVTTFKAQMRGLPRSLLERATDELHERFWANREGPPVPLSEDSKREALSTPEEVMRWEEEPPNPLPWIRERMEDAP